MEPWYEYLALPVAPIVLCAQVLAGDLRSPRLRRTVTVGCAVAIAAMTAIAWTIPPATEHDANIGGGVLALELLASLGLLLWARRPDEQP